MAAEIASRLSEPSWPAVPYHRIDGSLSCLFRLVTTIPPQRSTSLVVFTSMFNAPRPVQPYSSANGFGGSFVVDNPLSHSVYDSDGLDPWSTAPSPAPPPILPSTSTATSGFSTVIGGELSLHPPSSIL